MRRIRNNMTKEIDSKLLNLFFHNRWSYVLIILCASRLLVSAIEFLIFKKLAEGIRSLIGIYHLFLIDNLTKRNLDWFWISTYYHIFKHICYSALHIFSFKANTQKVIGFTAQLCQINISNIIYNYYILRLEKVYFSVNFFHFLFPLTFLCLHLLKQYFLIILV